MSHPFASLDSHSNSNDHCEILAETELAQRLVEVLIMHVKDVFVSQNNDVLDVERVPIIV